MGTNSWDKFGTINRIPAASGETMSQVYEALRQLKKEQGNAGSSPFPTPAEPIGNSAVGSTEFDAVTSVEVKVTPSSRLVALSEPQSLGAEKFRALATRLENLRHQKELKSLQITSGAVNEGKTMVAANLAVTFAKHSRSKV